MKIKLKNKYAEYEEREGTKTVGDSMTDQSQQEECDIYNCLKKYGITTLVNKTQAQEYMYLDNTNRNLTLDEAVRQRNQMNEYFKQQPARVRKVFGDNVDNFIEKYKAGQFDEMLQTGVLNEDMIRQLTPQEVTQPSIEKQEIMKGEIKHEQVEENISSNKGISADIN